MRLLVCWAKLSNVSSTCARRLAFCASASARRSERALTFLAKSIIGFWYCLCMLVMVLARPLRVAMRSTLSCNSSGKVGAGESEMSELVPLRKEDDGVAIKLRFLPIVVPLASPYQALPLLEGVCKIELCSPCLRLVEVGEVVGVDSCSCDVTLLRLTSGPFDKPIGLRNPVDGCVFAGLRRSGNFALRVVESMSTQSSSTDA